MERSDFKFVPMYAFEGGYLDAQKALEPEERDVPKRKFDFSGEYGHGGENRPLRAEDLAIVRELAFSFSYPLRGRIECSGDRYAAGWDPYVRPENPAAFATGTAGFGSTAEHGEAIENLFKTDFEYYLPGDIRGTEYKVTVMSNDGSHSGPYSFTSYYQCRLDGYVRHEGGGSYGRLEPSKDNPKPSGDAVTGLYAYGPRWFRDTEPYASPSRVDLECLLLGLARSNPDPAYSPKPVETWSPLEDSPDTDPMSRGSYAFPEPIEDEYKSDGHKPGEPNRYIRNRFIAVLAAAKGFRVVPDSVMDALWNATRISESGVHPKLSHLVLDTLYSSLNGLEFVRTFPIRLNNDRGLRDSDDWYLEDEDCLLVRALGGAVKWFQSRDTGSAECTDTRSGSLLTTTCVYPEPVYGDEMEAVPEDYSTSLLHISWTAWLTLTKTTNTWDTEAGKYLGGTSEWYVDKTRDFSARFTGEGAVIEISTPAGIPKCVTVASVNLLLDVALTYADIVEYPGYAPSTDSSSTTYKNARIPIEVKMYAKNTKYGRVFSGTVKATDIEAVCDYDDLVPDGKFTTYVSGKVMHAEVKFKIGVPS